MENTAEAPIRLTHYLSILIVVAAGIVVLLLIGSSGSGDGGMPIFTGIVFVPAILVIGLLTKILDKVWNPVSQSGEIVKVLAVLFVLGMLIYPLVRYLRNGTPMSEICPTCVPVPGQPGMYRSR